MIEQPPAGKIVIADDFWKCGEVITTMLEKADVTRMYFQEVKKQRPAGVEVLKYSKEAYFRTRFPDSIEVIWQGKKYLAGYYEPGMKFGFVELEWDKS